MFVKMYGLCDFVFVDSMFVNRCGLFLFKEVNMGRRYYLLLFDEFDDMLVVDLYFLFEWGWDFFFCVVFLKELDLFDNIGFL